MKNLILFFTFLIFLSCRPETTGQESKKFEIRKGTNLGVWLSQTDSRILDVKPEEFIRKTILKRLRPWALTMSGCRSMKR